MLGFCTLGVAQTLGQDGNNLEDFNPPASSPSPGEAIFLKSRIVFSIPTGRSPVRNAAPTAGRDAIA